MNGILDKALRAPGALLHDEIVTLLSLEDSKELPSAFGMGGLWRISKGYLQQAAPSLQQSGFLQQQALSLQQAVLQHSAPSLQQAAPSLQQSAF